ncbi:hypothetical protein OPV22_002680 [Ensete ventricosum]|uniref:FLZ-type domain-containing protein n=1 Tax=Ensete ventricosum TaxID=4639 RepID=A0AAV8RYP5_ENSVE|nr:hypothetical protein OPV22_002680 [Ensete ventricosum]
MKSFYSSSDLEAGCPPPHNFMEAAVASPPPKARFFCGGLDDDEPHHFLDSCNLCRKPLPRNRDIFMYRGDIPFCSEECRQEQIEMDEGKEKKWKLSLKATSRKDSNKGGSPTSPPNSHKVHVRTGTAVAAG